MKTKKKRKPVSVNIKALRKLLSSISRLPESKKVRIRNTAIATLVVVLVAGIFATVPQLQNYFSSQPSSALEAGLYPGGGLEAGTPIPYNKCLGIGWPPKFWKPEGELTTVINGSSVLPKIYDNIIVYMKQVGEHEFDVYMKNLFNSNEDLIEESAGNPDIYDTYIIWVKDSEELDEFGFPAWNNIFMKDISQPNPEEINITDISSSGRRITSSAIYGDSIVWIEQSDYPASRIMKYSISADTIAEIRPWSDYLKESIALHGDIVVWKERVSLDLYNTKDAIYMAHITDPGNTTVMVDPPNSYTDQENPAVYGDWIVWSASFKTQVDIHMKNIVTGNPSINLTNGKGGFNHPNIVPVLYAPAIYENLIIWNNFKQDSVTGFYSSNIWLHRISDPIGCNHQLTDNSPNGLGYSLGRSDMFENRMVWSNINPDNPGTDMFELLN